MPTKIQKTPAKPARPELLSVRQAAEITQLSKTSIVRAYRTGEIRYFKVAGGNAVRLYADDLWAWIERNTIGGGKRGAR